jgi:hypothetical protein
MKIIKKIIPILFVALLMLSSMSPVYAQDTGTDNRPPDTGTQNSTSGNNSGTEDISIRLGNPLENGGVRDIPTLVREILKIVITVGVPIVALAIIYSGFLFVAAQGNPEKLKKAKDTLLYVIIGAAILLGAYVIAEAIEATVAAIRGN